MQKEWGFPLFNVVRRSILEKDIRSLLEKPIEDAGYILDEVFYGKEDNINTLRLVIDKQGYIKSISNRTELTSLIFI